MDWIRDWKDSQKNHKTPRVSLRTRLFHIWFLYKINSWTSWTLWRRYLHFKIELFFFQTRVRNSYFFLLISDFSLFLYCFICDLQHTHKVSSLIWCFISSCPTKLLVSVSGCACKNIYLFSREVWELNPPEVEDSVLQYAAWGVQGQQLVSTSVRIQQALSVTAQWKMFTEATPCPNCPIILEVFYSPYHLSSRIPI